MIHNMWSAQHAEHRSQLGQGAVVLPNPFTLVHVLGGICDEFLQPQQVRAGQGKFSHETWPVFEEDMHPSDKSISCDHNLL